MTNLRVNLAKYRHCLQNYEPIKLTGRVTQMIGLVIESSGPQVSLNELCYIYPKHTSVPIRAEVVGFKEDRVLLMPLDETHGMTPGSEVLASGKVLHVKVGNAALGRVFDGLGNPIDGRGEIPNATAYPIYSSPPHPLKRRRINQVISVGIKAIDGLLTCGRGQRVGIFAGSGVGKSTLLGMIARNTSADVNVIALIGERGREVRDFLEKDLGDEGLKRSVVVVVTSDQPAVVRVKGALTATAIAEYFRDQGLDVMLLMDSVTRFAMAQREIGLAIGEPPTTRGYTPSVFAMLPKLLERCGTAEKGTITGMYTVLVDGDDFNEPIADAVRGILDGHIVLSRELAQRNHYPAIDVLSSVSRLMVDLVTDEHQRAASELRDILATYKSAEDLINIGAYVQGSNPRIDLSIQMIGEVRAFLQQKIGEKVNFDTTQALLTELFK